MALESGHHVPPGTSEAVTRGVRVTVEAQYSAQHSQPTQDSWFFLYTVRIANESADTRTTDQPSLVSSPTPRAGRRGSGPGRLGEQPVLERGEAFEYTSGCPLSTPFGTMRGTYQLVTRDGERFDTEIAPFTLRAPPRSIDRERLAGSPSSCWRISHSSTIRPPIRCSWMIRSNGGSQPRYHAPSG